MFQSAESVDTDTQRLIPSNERVNETNILLLVVGMGYGVIIIHMEMAQTISNMGSAM